MPKKKKATPALTPFEKALKVLPVKSGQALAEALGISRQAVARWRKAGVIPEERAIQIKELWPKESKRINFSALTEPREESGRSAKMRDLVRRLGGIQAVADEMGVGYQAVRQWIEAGRVPYDLYLTASFMHLVLDYGLEKVKFSDFTDEPVENYEYACAILKQFKSAYG